MRHHVFGKKLSRDIKERTALFRGLMNSLITHGKIRTTKAKAEAIRSGMEKLVTLAKNGSTISLSNVQSALTRKETIKKLTEEIAPNFKDRKGGYLRMTKVGKRAGDAAEEVILEWSNSS